MKNQKIKTAQTAQEKLDQVKEIIEGNYQNEDGSEMDAYEEAMLKIEIIGNVLF